MKFMNPISILLSGLTNASSCPSRSAVSETHTHIRRPILFASWLGSLGLSG